VEGHRCVAVDDVIMVMMMMMMMMCIISVCRLVLVVSAVQNIQSTMLRQISSVVEDEISDMPEPDVISQSPRQSRPEYDSPYYTARIMLLSLLAYVVFRSTS